MEAYFDDVPLLIVHIDTDRKDVGKGILHELESPEDIFRHFVKASFRVNEPSTLTASLHDALRTCSTHEGDRSLFPYPSVSWTRRSRGSFGW
jgi:thiamine pyrophosphate-dependent acetolactate synthase large subunit-like protein